jgi:hypothetical protein
MAKIKIAKIVNKFGLKFYVPIWKAKIMLANSKIEDYEIVETDKVKNFDKPQSQEDFNKSMKYQNVTPADIENQSLKEQIALLTKKIELEGKLKANTKVNTKITETKTDIIVDLPEISVKPNELDTLKQEAKEK